MPRGPKGEKRPADVIGAAIKVAKIATGEIEEDTKPDDGKKSYTPEIQTETVPRNVRFTPESGHFQRRLSCPLSAKSGHSGRRGLAPSR